MFFLCLSRAGAQVADRQTVASSGDYVMFNANYTFQTTVGEVAIHTLQTANLMLTQGFQQPEQMINLPIPAEGFPSDITVYPNPAVDQVKIQFQLNAPAWLKFVLVNNAGQVIRQLPLSFYQAGLQEVPFNFQVASGLYLLSLDHEGKVFTYKVIIQ